MNKIISFIKSQNIEDKNIKTTHYSINKEYEWIYEPKRERKFKGYKATHTIKVKSKDDKTASKIIAKASEYGADSVSSLQFELEDKAKLKEQATLLAIKDAKDKAAKLAKSLGVRILRIQSYSDKDSRPYPVFMYKKEVALDALDEPTEDFAPQIEFGENIVRAKVNINFLAR